MKKVIAMFLALAMTMSLVACGSSSTSDGSNAETDGNSTSSSDSTTTKTDATTLNVYISSEPAHLDPALNSTVDGAVLAVNSFEGLMRYNSDGELEGACAESYEVSEDGLTYTFYMREGLKWSNGDDLDATDFEYSWKRAGDPETAADYSYLCEVFAGYDEETGLSADSVVASEDGTTLTVTLSAVCPYFLDLCAFPFFFPVYQETVESTATDAVPTGTWANDAGDDFVCNGAYVLESWNHDSDMTYVKNEYYWDADSVSITTLNYMLTSSDTSAYTAYQTGDLDFIDSVPTDELSTAMESDEFYTIDELGTYYFGFNYNSDLYAELGLDEEEAIVFRHAIALLIDRDYIVETIGQTGQVVANTFIPEAASDGNGGTWGELTDGYYSVDDYEANVEEAKELLESIGLYDTSTDSLTTDITFTYLTNNTASNVSIAEAIQADLASTVGIDMQIDQQEWNVFLEERKNGNFDVAREGWVMDYDDPINMLEMWTTSSGNNDCQFGRDDSKDLDWSVYDSLISEIRVTADLEERTALMLEAEQMLMDTWCVIPLYYYNDSYMVKDYVEGIYGTAMGYKYFYHATINVE